MFFWFKSWLCQNTNYWLEIRILSGLYLPWVQNIILSKLIDDELGWFLELAFSPEKFFRWELIRFIWDLKAHFQILTLI